MIKKRNITLVLAALFIMSVLTSSVLACEEPPSCTRSTALLAGQHWVAGDVILTRNADGLHVEYIVNDPWSLGETHLYVGTTPPTKAAPGRFPYKGSEGEYWVPWSEIGAGPYDTLYIAAHAVVDNGDQEETAWADTWGIPIRPGKGWALYVPFPPCDPGS